MRAVLDTNVLVSACWNPSGLESRTVALALRGEILACATQAVWDEYESVLGRPKFRGLRQISEKLLLDLRRTIEVVEPRAVEEVCRDPKDHLFLECAAGAQAGYLVTGNRKHFPALCGTAAIVNAREFLDRIDSPSIHDV